MDNERIESIMKTLNISKEQAIDLLEYDKAVDRTTKERLKYDLSLEDEKRAKKLANVTEHKRTAYNFSKRERKPNMTKRAIIEYLMECFAEYDNVVMTNKERQIAFSCDGNDYELTLVQKRKKKEGGTA